MTEKLHKRTKDLTGQRFNSLVVLEFAGYKHNGAKCEWTCKCDCGTILSIRAQNINRGQKSCWACSRKEQGLHRIRISKTRNSEHVALWYLNKRRHSANKYRDIIYDITLQDAEDQWVKQGGRCALTDLELTPTSNFISSSHHKGENTASLDRIDSKKGYIIGNIQWLHKDANNVKQSHSQEYLIEMSILVAEKAKRDKKEKQ